MQQALLLDAIGVLGLFAVLERLWSVAHGFHVEGPEQAEALIENRPLWILEGDVEYLIGG